MIYLVQLLPTRLALTWAPFYSIIVFWSCQQAFCFSKLASVCTPHQALVRTVSLCLICSPCLSVLVFFISQLQFHCQQVAFPDILSRLSSTHLNCVLLLFSWHLFAAFIVLITGRINLFSFVLFSNPRHYYQLREERKKACLHYSQRHREPSPQNSVQCLINILNEYIYLVDTL